MTTEKIKLTTVSEASRDAITYGYEDTTYYGYNLPMNQAGHVDNDTYYLPMSLLDLFNYLRANGEKTFLGYIMARPWDSTDEPAQLDLDVPDLVAVPGKPYHINNHQSWVVYKLNRTDGAYHFQQNEPYGISALYYAQEEYLDSARQQLLWLPYVA